jgi:Amt family ammonium transporter
MTFSAIDTVWVLIGSALVFIMQAGFAMVETGFTRAKNAGNIIMKNLMDFAIGSVVFWIIGFGLMFGDGNGFIGTLDLFLKGNYDSGIPTYAFVIFQTVFCATAATIVSGAMAERTKFIAYVIYSAVISAVIYPISGHWIWGGGWLGTMGFTDFAGSTAVHMVGGIAALIGAILLGPRIGKYDKNGKPRAILGHSLTLGALGVFLLWCGWVGFNPASSLGAEGQEVAISTIYMTTNIAAAAAACATMIVTWFRYKKPDVSMTLNGALAGLVAITAGCASVNPAGAAIIGTIAGIVVVFSVEFFDKVLKIDDPVGAVSVHGVCGALGTILVGFFAVDGGVFYGGGAHLLGVQALGVVSVAAYVTVAMLIVFGIIKKTIGLRVSPEEELAGLDISEHGLASSYADFFAPPVINGSAPAEDIEMGDNDTVVTVKPDKTTGECTKMTNVTVITNQTKFETLKAALEKIGITGMTVTQVMGCGMQKGKTEFYRGVEVEMNLLPKVKVEIVVCKIPVETVIATVKKALYTNNIGDGKIFVYDVENVVKVRTGEAGYDALQDEEE